MKISIREALFAGDEVDAWEPSGSEWIMAHMPGSGWTDEFLGLKGLSNNKSAVKIIMPHMFVIYSQYIEDFRGYHFSTNGASLWRIWYNEKLDSYLVAHENSPKSIYDNNEKLEAIQKYIEENLENMDKEVYYKKIGIKL